METKNTKIYMRVDTQNIQPGKEEDYVEFKDDRKNPEFKKDPKNFVSEINPAKKVFWYGEPKSQKQDTIEILDIKKKDGNPEFLKSQGKDPSHNGAYMADVIDSMEKGEEGYDVIFKIKNKEGQFKVDPKLLMKI